MLVPNRKFRSLACFCEPQSLVSHFYKIFSTSKHRITSLRCRLLVRSQSPMFCKSNSSWFPRKQLLFCLKRNNGMRRDCLQRWCQQNRVGFWSDQLRPRKILRTSFSITLYSLHKRLKRFIPQMHKWRRELARAQSPTVFIHNEGWECPRKRPWWSRPTCRRGFVLGP